VNGATAVVLSAALVCVALVLIVRMVLESQGRGKGEDISLALKAAEASAFQAAEAAKHAAKAEDTMLEMQGALTALSIRMGLRGQPQRGYPGSEPPAEPKV
jgi:hypothetical protein